MLYTPSHVELGQHPKTKKLARLLGVSIPTAIGHLHLLWHFALKYAQDGDITRFDDADIAEGCMWEGDPQTLCVALHGSGFVDTSPNNEPLTIWLHDWQDYGGKAIKQKEGNADRQQRWRDKRKGVTKQSPNAPVTVTSPLYNALEEKRLEERRLEETRGERGRPDSPPPTRAPKRADARPTLPSAEQLVADLRDWADQKGVRDILESEVERFRDYCLSGKNGKPVTYADYPAACRKWITNPNYSHSPPAPARDSPNGYHGKPSATEGFAALAQRFKREADDGPGHLPDAIDVPFAIGEAHRRHTPRGA